MDIWSELSKVYNMDIPDEAKSIIGDVMLESRRLSNAYRSGYKKGKSKGFKKGLEKAYRTKRTPCDLCHYNPPSSRDDKPCTACPAIAKVPICDTCNHKGKSWYEEPCDGCCRAHSGYERM